MAGTEGVPGDGCSNRKLDGGRCTDDPVGREPLL